MTGRLHFAAGIAVLLVTAMYEVSIVQAIYLDRVRILTTHQFVLPLGLALIGLLSFLGAYFLIVEGWNSK